MPIDRYRKDALPQDSDPSGALSRNLDRVERLGRSLELIPFLDGELIRDIAYTGTAVSKRHGLKRKWTGYIPTKMSAAVSVTATEANNPEATKDSVIAFTASGNATFDVWVF